MKLKLNPPRLQSSSGILVMNPLGGLLLVGTVIVTTEKTTIATFRVKPDSAWQREIFPFIKEFVWLQNFVQFEASRLVIHCCFWYADIIQCIVNNLISRFYMPIYIGPCHYINFVRYIILYIIVVTAVTYCECRGVSGYSPYIYIDIYDNIRYSGALSSQIVSTIEALFFCCNEFTSSSLNQERIFWVKQLSFPFLGYVRYMKLLFSFCESPVPTTYR